MWKPSLESFNLKEISLTVILSYLVTWGFFFLTLPFFIKIAGKVAGPVINYIISWILMVGIVYIIHFYDRRDDLSSSFAK